MANDETPVSDFSGAGAQPLRAPAAVPAAAVAAAAFKKSRRLKSDLFSCALAALSADSDAELFVGSSELSIYLLLFFQHMPLWCELRFEGQSRYRGRHRGVVEAAVLGLPGQQEGCLLIGSLIVGV